jgi:Family of unknown function (DUF6644)
MFVYDINANPLNNTEWAFPVTECVHILGFALSIGTIALVDFRLLGLGKGRAPAKQILKDTAPWTLIGLAIMLTSGPLIFSSDPVRYYYNESFRFKIIALLIAIIFNYTIHRKVVQSGTSPMLGRLVGALSLALWVSVVAGGLFIGFV